MEFAEHSAIQTKLTEIWKGSITLHTSELKVDILIEFILKMLFLFSSSCLPGFLFYLANIAGSALNVVACTEGVLSNFGATQGALVHILPEDHWWQVQIQTQTQTQTHIGDK